MIVPVQGDTGDTIPGDAGGELVVIILTADIKRFVFLWSVGCLQPNQATDVRAAANTRHTRIKGHHSKAHPAQQCASTSQVLLGDGRCVTSKAATSMGSTRLDTNVNLVSLHTLCGYRPAYFDRAHLGGLYCSGRTPY